MLMWTRSDRQVSAAQCSVQASGVGRERGGRGERDLGLCRIHTEEEQSQKKMTRTSLFGAISGSEV